LLLCLSLLSASLASAKPPPGYQLAWSDEFKGHTLDTNKWNDWLLGSRRDATDVTNAITVRHGHLTITSYSEGTNYFTGMVSTKGKFEPVHGYWEARIKFKDSPGMWSAFWLQSPTMGHPLHDPGQAGVEIDICEHRVVSTEGEKLAGKIQHTLHWDGYGQDHKSIGHLSPELKLNSGYHLYGFEWTTNEYKFYIDGKLTWTNHDAVSNAKEFAILSSEIETTAWAGHIPTGGYGDLAHSRTKMIVDHVRYYTPKN
jgi:beta-glucanase (GH16 family)